MGEQQHGRATWKDLRPRTQLAIIFAVVTLVLGAMSISSAAARADRATTPVAGSSSLPMTPSGSYTVGDQYYADKIPMPNYVGWTLQAAVNDLAARGITVRGMDPSATRAVIVEQSPYPGTRVGQATANSIQLMVGVPASSTTTTTTPPPTTTTTVPPTETAVDIDVDDDTNLPDGALSGGYCRRKWWC